VPVGACASRRRQRWTPRLGRPPEFTERARLEVLLEASELRRIQDAARAARVSASTWARRRLVAALPRSNQKRGTSS
jgi:hypothetical protein